MGIFIHMNISKATTAEEWKAVYEEALKLVDVFPLSEHHVANCSGINVDCIVRTKERKHRLYGEERVGWTADGDYETLCGAEDYSLFKDWISDEDVALDAGDAMLGVLSSYLEYDWKDPLCSNTYCLWGNKSQGEPYHMYLLAIACLINSRLGNKAFIHGDITNGQCKRAVEIANTYLEEAIDVPTQCDMERHWKRVSALPISENDQLELYIKTFLGFKDAEFGVFLKTHYSSKLIGAYWKRRLKKTTINTRGGSAAISQYLLWGFNLSELCGLVQLIDEEQKSLLEVFIKRIMDAKMHWKEKDCQNVLGIDTESSTPYSICTLMGQFAFGGAENKKIDRYVPLENIREQLKAGLGNTTDIDCIIDNYLKREEELRGIGPVTEETSEEELTALCEQDAHSALQQILEIKRRKREKAMEGYDITQYEHLPYYESGEKIRPDLDKVLLESFKFYNSCCQTDFYIELKDQNIEEKCKWLIERNQYICIRDTDWIKIFDDIGQNPDSFSRYFPMVMVVADSMELHEMVRALVINDDLYAYCENQNK